MRRLFIGVHRVVDLDPRDPGSALGLAIDVMTRVRWGGPGGTPPPGGWVLGEPATHAFVVVADETGARRFDAMPPHLVATAFERPVHPTALWEILPADTPWGRVDPAGGVMAAWASIGTGYDLAQCVLQALGPVVRAPFPGAPTPPFQFTADPGRVICTEAACKVLEKCGGPAAILAKDTMQGDHYPEELGGRLQNAVGGSWLRRLEDFADLV